MSYKYEIVDICAFEKYKYDNSMNYDRAREIWNSAKDQKEKKEVFDKVKRLLDHILTLNENDVEIEFLEDKLKKLCKKLQNNTDENKNDDNSENKIDDDIEEINIDIDYMSLLNSYSPIAFTLMQLSFKDDLEQFEQRLRSTFTRIRSYLYKKHSILNNIIKDIKSSFINENDVYITKSSFQCILKRYSIESLKVLSSLDVDIMMKYLDIEDNQSVNILLFLDCILGNKSENLSKLPTDLFLNKERFEVTNNRIVYKCNRVEQNELKEIKRIMNNNEEYMVYENSLFEILNKVRKRYKRNVDKFWRDSYIIESSSANPVGEFV